MFGVGKTLEELHADLLEGPFGVIKIFDIPDDVHGRRGLFVSGNVLLLLSDLSVAVARVVLGVMHGRLYYFMFMIKTKLCQIIKIRLSFRIVIPLRISN